MKTFKNWKRVVLSLATSCMMFATAAAISLFQLPANENVVAAGESSNNVTVDFSASTDVSNFAVANSDGKVGTVTDGKYYPNSWAQNYCTIAIPTDSTRHVAFDFYLPSIEDTGTTYSQMWVGLITDPADINTAGKSLGMQMGTQLNVTYFYKNAQKQGSYLGQFPKLTFGAEHHMEMYIENGIITYAIDGSVVRFTEGFTTVDAPSNGTDSNAYLFFEFSSAKGYVDNIVVSDCTSLDFSSNLVASKFISTLSGGTQGTADEGVFKPAAWARNYWVTPIDTTEDIAISYDFYMPSYEALGSTYSQFYAALISDLEDINGTDESGNAKSVTFRLYDNGSVSPRSTSYSVWPSAQSASAASSLAWLEDVSYFDALHHMEIKIVGGKITYCVDGTALFGKTFAVPADTVYFFFEMSHAGGYIDNLQVEVLPFEEINLDFSSAATGSSYFTNVPSATNWSLSGGTFKSGGTYRATYMTTPIPMNEFKYIAFDWYEPNVANSSAAANFRFGLTTDITNRNKTGNSIGLYLWQDKTWLTSHANSTSGWLASLSTVALGQVKRIEMIIENEKITFIVGGTTLKSSYALPFADQDTSTKEYAYLVLDDAVGAGAYIDNFVVWNKDTYNAYKQEQLELQYSIQKSNKSFVGYDEKLTPNTKDSGLAWGSAYSALKDGGTIRRSTYYSMQYDWSGAEYYAFDVVNDTDGFVAFGLDVKEGYYAQNGAVAAFGTGSIMHGRWWTMGEYMPYYLVDADGTVKSGVTGRNTVNRGEAIVPIGFKGTVVLPISSFEVLDWSANTAQYNWFTEDANVLALNHILFADLIYNKITATTGSVTTSNERLLSSDFGASASVARTVRAIDQIGTVSAASERLIAFARSNYDALSAEDQAQVTNYAKLTAAETAFYNLSDNSYVIGTDGKDFEGTGGVAFSTVFDSAPSTVSAWVKVSRDVADSEHVGTVVGNAERKMSSSVLYDYWYTFSFEITTNGNPKFEWRVSRTSKAVFVVENADVRTGKWMHVAFTRDAANGLLTCYINGVAVATMQTTSAKLASFSFVKPVMIGSDYTDDKILAAGFTPDFHGSIADVRIYSSLLDEAEVANDSNGVIADKDGLLGAIDFASGEIEEYYDHVNGYATDAFGWKEVDNGYFEAQDGEFTFAVIPDTQMIFSRANGYNPGTNIYAEGYDAEQNLGFRTMQWLIDNKTRMNLQYVAHVGDLTDNLNYYSTSSVDSSKKKWEVEGKIEAKYAFQMLGKLTDAGIPWSLARGNHDGGFDSGALAAWDEYWTESEAYRKATTDDRLEGEPAKYCVTARNSTEYIYSYYEKIEIGDLKYLMIVLDLEADDTILAWANEVAAYFTDYKIIVSTHAYLGSRGALMTSLMGSAGVNNYGKTVWEEFVSQHKNIELMLCGHSSGEDIVRSQLTGVHGNKVWTFMIDSSAHEFTGVTQPGLISLLKFSADGRTLTLNHYSMEQGELFGSYNSFTVTLGEQEITEEPDEPEAVWPDETDDRQIVLMPNVQPFGVYTSSAGLRNNTTGDSTTLQIAYNGVQFRDNWKAYAVSIDIEADGVYKFDADAYIKAKNGRVSVLQTCAKDGLTRIVPLTDPDDTDTIAYANGMYGAWGSSGGSLMMTSILPDGITVAKGDKITILFTGSTSYWGKMLFDGAVYDANGAEVQDCDLNMTSATIANNLYKAGYNGLMADGTASSYKNYKGFSAGWLHLTGSFANFYTQYTNTVTVTDENANTLFTATSSGMGNMIPAQNKLPTLCKEGYTFLGYEIEGTMYAGNTYSVKGTTSSGGTTQTVVAKFEKIVIPEAIFDTDGNAVIDTSAGFNGALPTLSRSGHVFLGYLIDGALYPAGTQYDAEGGKTAVAVFANFSMVNGAAVRMKAPTGMRFQTYLDKGVYDAYLSSIVTFGTLIAKADDITVDGVLDYSKLTTDAAMTKLNIVSTAQKTVGNYLYFNGVLAEIKESHYGWKFAARGYMTVTYADGTTATIYANVTNNARSVSEVAARALADVSRVVSKHYSTAVSGGYSAYSEAERTVLAAFVN